MTRQERPARASPTAPVEYPEIRTSFRLGRVALCGLLLAGSLAGWAWGVPGSLLKAAVAGSLIVLALADRLPTPLPGLTVLVFALAATAGTAGHTDGPLAALTGCALAASLVVLPARLAVVPALTLAAGAALRLTVLSPPPAADEPAGMLATFETALFVTAVGLGGLVASRAVQAVRRRLAQSLDSERQAMAMKNEFVSMVSHELRTPLTNISGFAMALRDSWRVFDQAEVDEFLTVICGEAEHLRRLVDDVLVVPRLEVDRLLIEPADFPLRPAAYRIADLVFPSGGAKSASVTVGGNVVLHADPNRVEQVLRNLLENAAKYGGDQVAIDAVARGDDWLITVSDDGPGIAEAHRDRVFAPFEQGAPSASPGSGLGLGLTVSRVLVEAMGGRIWYEPGFPRGARFCFTLPAARAAATTPVGS